jgi:predicted nuclease of predicted toxin-antitoxin system
MKLLLDQGLPRQTAEILRSAGLDAVHVGDIGLSSAEDAEILSRARQEDRIVVTLDADFHALLAFSGLPSPSVIRVRIEGLRTDRLATLLLDVIGQCKEALSAGAMITVQPARIRIRRLT